MEFQNHLLSLQVLPFHHFVLSTARDLGVLLAHSEDICISLAENELTERGAAIYRARLDEVAKEVHARRFSSTPYTDNGLRPYDDGDWEDMEAGKRFSRLVVSMEAIFFDDGGRAVSAADPFAGEWAFPGYMGALPTFEDGVPRDLVAERCNDHNGDDSGIGVSPVEEEEAGPESASSSTPAASPGGV